MDEAESFVPFQGIKKDVKGRLKCYKQDWISGLRAGFRYIFFFFAFTGSVHVNLTYAKYF